MHQRQRDAHRRFLSFKLKLSFPIKKKKKRYHINVMDKTARKDKSRKKMSTLPLFFTLFYAKMRTAVLCK